MTAPCPLCGAAPPPLEDFQVDLDSNFLRAGRHYLQVTPTMAEFAWLLRRAWPAPAHRERLMDGLYGTRSRDPPEPQILNVFASRLRHLLKGSGWTVLPSQGCGFRLARGEWSGLSRRRQALVDEVAAFEARNGHWPRARDLRARGIYESRQSFYQALKILEQGGHLRRRRNGAGLIVELASGEAHQRKD